MLMSSAGSAAIIIPQVPEKVSILPETKDYRPKVVFRRDASVISLEGGDGDLAGEVFTCDGGTVRFRIADTQRSISEVLATVGMSERPDAFAVMVFTQRRHDGFPLILRMRARRDEREGVIGVLTVVDLDERRHVPKTLLRATFGLTVAEAAIASALAEGETLQDIAARTGVRMSTLRTQLTSVLAKTGTSRQAQLICLLAKLVAVSEGEPA